MVCLTDAEEVLATLPKHHDGKFGYVVYRVSYGNDQRWNQFLERLDAFAQIRLNNGTHNQKLKEFLVWDVRENELELKDASKSTVRLMFAEWIQSVKGSCDLTRYTVCIYADEEVINSVLEDEDPADGDIRLNFRPRAFVKLIHAYFEETPMQFTKQEIPDDEQREKMNAGDEGYPPIEGCKRRDVGWMKSSVKWLVSVTYHYMGNGGWHEIYVRPPKVSAGGG